MREIEYIIEALGRHCDDSAVRVLEEIGTNSSDDLVRELTAKALISRNTHDSLRVVLISKGKGIHVFKRKCCHGSYQFLKIIV